jgi:probable F420-dependent oxidoreductase
VEFGAVFQCDPPAWRVVELARQAENHGFSHVWTFDSHLLWQEPFVVHSQILAATHRVHVGPMVTNPATRDWTLTASVFATLNDMFGNRTVCGIGRGDSAVRVTNGRPVTLATLREAIEVIRGLANGGTVDYKGNRLRLPWGEGSRLPVWVAAYGPRALALAGEVADGFILQVADPDVAAQSIAAVRTAAAEAGRDPGSVRVCVAAPAYLTDGGASARAHAREQCRWFGGMVGNHVADLVARYGADSPAVPAALSASIARRPGYDYNGHGKPGHAHTDFVTDEVVDRFCLVGPPDEHIRRLAELRALGVDQFALYLQHDAKDATLAGYGEQVIGAVNARAAALL